MSTKLEHNPFILWAKQRIEKNRNVIGVFLGSTGSGKSFGALDFSLELAEEFGTPFSVENNVAFDFKNMLSKMMLPANQAKGTVFLLEEVGAVGSGGASSEWMSKANAFFSSFLQTSRHRNQILIFTTPNYSLLTKQARQLIHFNIEMLSVNRQTKISVGKFKLCQTNPVSGKTYMKYLRVLIGTQRTAVPMIQFKLPPNELLDTYEAEKLKYTTALNQMILDTLEEKENKKEAKKGNYNNQHTLDTTHEERVRKAREYHDKGLRQKEIGKLLGITDRAVRNLLNVREEECDAPTT